MSPESITPETIFTQAIDIADAVDRTAFLDRVCAHDSVLRSEVEKLVQDHFQAGDFLERPAIQIGPTVNQPAVEPPGSHIGRYKLLQQIGEGGMGVVYMAEQTEPVERRVALKIIKPGMDSRQVIARFEAERQALALMDHPNIARVLDAGTTDSGQPYFVMELVKGVPITQYCDEQRLTPQKRLELFAAVCHAVQHAHQKGIIHRDIKPSNVLVAEYDEKPLPKVIDFGVAKATGQRLTEKSMFTEFGQVVGTIEYMSPEQAKLNQLDIDTRTDVYSLGVLLYELLTGETPFDRTRLHNAAFDEMLRIVREEEPPKPSTRLSGSGSLPSVAANRHLEPGRLTALVRGDLDWIVMKSLEKDRSRRYETANGLAMDIQRYLADEPVLACPPSATYRFGKFARRNRVALTTATLVAATLVLGTIVSTWQAIRAETARAAEVEQRKVAETQRSEAERQRARAEANFQKARKTVDEYFTLVSESRLLDVPGLQPLRKELLDAALRFYQQTAVERTNDPGVLADVAVTYLRVAQVDHLIGRNDESIAAIDSALDVIDRLRRNYPGTKEQHRRLAGFWKGYRPTQSRTDMPKNPQAALKTLQRAIETWQELADEDAEQPAFQSDLASLCYLTGLMLGGVNERESLRYYERSKVLLEKLAVDQPDEPEHRADLARTYQGMVGKLSRAGRPVEAESAQSRSLSLREELVARFPNAPHYRAELARILSQRAGAIARQQPAEAENMFRRAVDLSHALVREFPDVAIYWEVLAANVSDWGKHVLSGGKQDQREYFERIVQDVEAWAIAWAADGTKGAKASIVLVQIHRAIAQMQTGQERLKTIRQGILACRRTVEAAQKLPTSLLPSPDSQALFASLAAHMDGFAELLARAGEFPEVVEISEQLIEVSEKLANLVPSGFESLGHACRWLHNTRGHEEEYLRKGIAAFERCVARAPNNASHRSFLANTLNRLGEILEARNENGEAESCFRKAWGVYETLLADSANNREYRTGIKFSYTNLIKVLLAQDKHAEAEDTLRAIAEMLDDDAPNRIVVGTLYRDSGDLDKAIADSSGVIAKDPTLAEAWDLRGSCYLRKGEFAKAAEDYSEAIKLKPGEAWYWHERGFAYLMLGQHEMSIADHSKAIEISDQDAGQRLRRGHSYRAVGESEKAEADYNRAVELNPAHWENWYSRGRLYVERGQSDKAEADFAKASEVCSKDAGSLNELAWRLATSADSSGRSASMAVELAKKGIELDPKNILLPNTLGVAHYRTGNWQDAIEWLDKSMEVRSGGDSVDWFFLAMTHWQLDNKDEARKWYAKAVEWMETNAPTNEELKRFRAEATDLLRVNEQNEK